MNDLHSTLADKDELIRDLRVRVGILESELEHLRREHAALKASIAQDVAALSRRYLDAAKPAGTGVRTVDGVIFGGWDHVDPVGPEMPESADADRNSRTA